MALIADDGADRAEQLILLTERLATLIQEETRLIKARQPPLSGALGEERTRLANAYRLELARIKQDKSLLHGAPPNRLALLRRQTATLQDILSDHELALGAVKLVTEGLVQAMAEEVARTRGGPRTYGAGGGLDGAATTSVALDQKA